jgi:hypothetical protein
MAKTFTIAGNTNQWLNTGINVHPGQWVRITANGYIHFATGGWARNANGVDQAGNGRERANASHPGPGLTKNSLIAHVGGRTVQAGADMAFRAPAGGPVQLMVNDDYRGDNGGQWAVTVDVPPAPLRLVQRLLVVTQGKGAATSLVENAIKDFAGHVHQYTGGVVQAAIYRTHIAADVPPGEMIVPHKDHANQRVAGYNQAFQAQLIQQGFNPADYDGVFRLYDQPPAFPHWGYWTWPFISGLPRRIGYTTIPVDHFGNTPDAGYGVLMHEYLHQMDGRFNEAGVPGFYDPDGKPGGMSNQGYYEHSLKQLPDGTPPPFGLLHRVFGQLV